MPRKKIVLIGSEGSGKTTLASFIKTSLEKEGNSAKIVFMGWKDFRNPLLKLASKIHLRNKKSRVESAENRLSRYKSRTWAFYSIYYLEMWSRYASVMFSNKDFIIMDRYFYDELAFAEGIKYKFFSLITPKPDLCIILKPSLSTLKKREHRYSYQKLEEFYSNLSKISKLSPTLQLNSSKSPATLYRQFKEFICKSL